MKDKMFLRNVKFVLLVTLLSFSSAIAESAPGKTYALVISGINKHTQDIIARAQAVSDLQKFLLDKTKGTTDAVKILTPDAERNSATTSRLENIRKIMNHFESVVTPADRFVFYYTGQANVVGQQLRFNLPGEDITQAQLAQLLERIKATSILIVLDCPASGLAVKALSRRGRIIICSCTDEQVFSAKFGEYFISALTGAETDIDENGKVSILEVFIGTSKKVEDWYRQKQLIITETPVLDDNGDGTASKEPWRYMIDVKDGLMASEFFL